jgi:hypothetical protein
MPEPETVPLGGPVDPRHLLADVLAERAARLLPWVDRQTDAPTREAYLDLLVGLSASVDALRDTESSCFEDHAMLAIRSLEAARPREADFTVPF